MLPRRPFRGIEAAREEVLVTMGAQHALWLVITLLSDRRPGLKVAIEEPGYSYLREMLAAAGCRIYPVPVDADGLPPEAVPEGMDLVCVTPSHQAPTGATMPATRRRALLARAQAEDFLIVEDDYDFEMSFLKPAEMALKATDPHGRVVHTGSFSKSLFPGLRLGYLVAAEPVIKEARGLRGLMLRHPPGTTQRTTAYFLALGHYNAHVRRLRAAFMDRREVMGAALESAGLAVAGAPDFGGAGFWVRGPEGMDATELAADLRQDGVLIEPGEAFYANPDGARHHFRMAYSSIAAASIPEGVRRVARRIRQG